ncbi:MAG: response regulator transcription factor [Neisseriaceae bacterium]|nr:response regulator transcription factor [Neisseriaceae bacterium]MBP6861232.1 response regulator transcription factor [Neisseriaceae bacterium]
MNPANTQQRVYVIDDDVDVRDSLKWLLNSVHLDVVCFENAQDFLEQCPADAEGCIIMDLRMPGLSGINAQKNLAKHQIDLPLIMISAHGSIDTAVTALQQGALTFLEKPFDDQVLIDHVQMALAQDQAHKASLHEKQALKARYNTLTKREKEVFQHVVRGLSNQETADALGVNRKTVEGHRANMIAKMASSSLADLVQAAVALELV